MTIRHIHPIGLAPAARAETMERLTQRCQASLAKLRRREDTL